MLRSNFESMQDIKQPIQKGQESTPLLGAGPCRRALIVYVANEIVEVPCRCCRGQKRRLAALAVHLGRRGEILRSRDAPAFSASALPSIYVGRCPMGAA